MREVPLERHWRRCYPNLDIYTLLLFGVEGGGCRVGRHSFLVIERNMAVRPSIILLGVGGSSHFLCRSRSAIADMNGSPVSTALTAAAEPITGVRLPRDVECRHDVPRVDKRESGRTSVGQSIVRVAKCNELQNG